MCINMSALRKEGRIYPRKEIESCLFKTSQQHSDGIHSSKLSPLRSPRRWPTSWWAPTSRVASGVRSRSRGRGSSRPTSSRRPSTRSSRTWWSQSRIQDTKPGDEGERTYAYLLRTITTQLLKTPMYARLFYFFWLKKPWKFIPVALLRFRSFLSGSEREKNREERKKVLEK